MYQIQIYSKDLKNPICYNTPKDTIEKTIANIQNGSLLWNDDKTQGYFVNPNAISAIAIVEPQKEKPPSQATEADTDKSTEE